MPVPMTRRDIPHSNTYYMGRFANCLSPSQRIYLNGHTNPNGPNPKPNPKPKPKPNKPNQTNQTKPNQAAPICLFTKTKTQKAAVAGWLSYARRRLWRLVPQSGVGANRRNHLGALHGADGPPPAGRRPGVPGNPADTGGRPGGSLGPQNEV